MNSPAPRGAERPQRGTQRSETVARSNRQWRFVALTCAGLVVFAILAYLGSLLIRSRALYDQPLRWHGRPYQADTVLGYRPRPGSRANHLLPDGSPVPVVFDALGLRVSDAASTSEPEGPSILFLGDSFTHGWGVPAEQTFAHRATRAVGGEARNAGVSGWGCAAMILQAEELIPRLRPAVVVAQASTWLAPRSQALEAPGRWGRIPVPYFVGSVAEGGLEIAPPIFLGKSFDLPISERSGNGFWPFTKEVGVPLLTHDDFERVHSGWARWRGRIPRPAASRQEVVDHTLGRLRDLSRSVGATMVVLVLPIDATNRPVDRFDVVDSNHHPIVDPHAALLAHLESPTAEAWDRAYAFWAGDPPQLVDRHPNPSYHAVVAATLVPVLREILDTESRAGAKD